MNEALLIILVLLWAVALLPSLWSRRRANTHATVGGFERAMDVLRDRPSGRYVMVLDDPTRVATVTRPEQGAGESPRVRRKRQRFVRLLAMTGVSFLLAFVWGGALWVIASGSALGLMGYASILRRRKVERDQAREVVRHLHPVEEYRVPEEVSHERVVGGEPMFPGAPDPRRRSAGPGPSGPGPSGPGPSAGSGPSAEVGAVQVVTRPDEPWAPQSSVRIRRWDA